VAWCCLLIVLLGFSFAASACDASGLKLNTSSSETVNAVAGLHYQIEVDVISGTGYGTECCSAVKWGTGDLASMACSNQPDVCDPGGGGATGMTWSTWKTVPSAPGDYTVTVAVYEDGGCGGTPSATLIKTLHVYQGASTTTLEVSDTSIVEGEEVQLTATVTSLVGDPYFTDGAKWDYEVAGYASATQVQGTVTFYADGQSLESKLLYGASGDWGRGIVSLMTTLPVGAPEITAEFISSKACHVGSASSGTTVTVSDVTPPTDPTPTSTSHTVNVWSNDDTVDIAVSGASDTGSGVDGFEVEWNQSATWTPTQTKEHEETWSGGTFTATSNGDWYFHVATVDGSGNWTSTEHLGPFRIDTTPPSVPTGLSPANGTYTHADPPTLSWEASSDTGGSGLRPTDTYRYVVVGGSSGYTGNLYYQPSLAEGEYVWRIRARDVAGNNSEYTSDRTLTIDRTAPTDPTPSSSSHQIGVISNDPTVDIAISGAGDPTSGGVSSGIDGFDTAWNKSPTWTATETVDVQETWSGGTFTATSDGEWYFHIATRDNAGNWTSTEDLGPFDIDTTPPDVEDVTVTDSLITDADASGIETFDVTVDFSEPMDTDIDPTIIFSPLVASTLTLNAGQSGWEDGDTYVAKYDVADGNTDAGSVTIGVTDAQDVAGNPQTEYTPESEFGIDTCNPEVTSLGVSDTLITDVDDGATFTVTVDFSEAMNMSATPTIGFDPHVNSTLSFVDGEWAAGFGDERYVTTYTISDADVDVNEVHIDVEGAVDANGNAQAAYTPGDDFGIDTLNPTITSITSTTPNGYYDQGQSVNIHVSFSEMVTLSGGTLDITLDTPADIVSVTAFTDTSADASYTIGSGDNSCDLDAIGVTLSAGTLRDVSGNDADVHLPDPTIADGSDIVVDTTNPLISGLDLPDATRSVNAGCSITIPYSATLTDNCCINTGVGSTDVQVSVTIVGGSGMATLDAPAAAVENNGIGQIDIGGSFTVTDVDGGDVVVGVEIDCLDCAGNSPAAASDTVTIDDSTDPVISGFNLPNGTLYVDADTCIYTVPYSATINDNCCLDAGDVSVIVEMVAPYDTATLTAPAATIANAGGLPNTQVSISGSFEVSALTNDPVHVRIRINATDCNGNTMTEASNTAVFEDGANPNVSWDIDLPDAIQYVSSGTCAITLPVRATVSDACCIDAANVTIGIEVTNATLAHDVTASQMEQGVVNVEGDITVSALTGCPAVLTLTIDAVDCAGNAATQLADSVQISDHTIPVIHDLRLDEHVVVDGCCEGVVTFDGYVEDNCCVSPSGITITVAHPTSNATVSFTQASDVIFTQSERSRVDFSGGIGVRCLTGCPANVVVTVNAVDCCGNPAETATSEPDPADWEHYNGGDVYDEAQSAPNADPLQTTYEEGRVDKLDVRLDESFVYRLIIRENTPERIDVIANDDDNCSLCTCCGTMWIDAITDEPDRGTATIEIDHGDCHGGSAIRYAPDRGYLGPDSFEYTVRDACGNVSGSVTVYLQMVEETVMEDVSLVVCTGESITFDVTAADLWVDRDPAVIPFGFEIVGGPDHGVVTGDLTEILMTPPSSGTDPNTGEFVPTLDFTETATIELTYVPAGGFVGRDSILIRFFDPFGAFAAAEIDIRVIECIESIGGIPAIGVAQGTELPIILPKSFGPTLESSSTAIVLMSQETGLLYPGSLSVVWSASASRHVLWLDTGALPAARYRLTIPLGDGAVVDLILEVGEGE